MAADGNQTNNKLGRATLKLCEGQRPEPGEIVPLEFKGGSANHQGEKIAVNFGYSHLCTDDKTYQSRTLLAAREFLARQKVDGHQVVGSRIETLTGSHAPHWLRLMMSLCWYAWLLRNRGLDHLRLFMATLEWCQQHFALSRLLMVPMDAASRIRGKVVGPGARFKQPGWDQREAVCLQLALGGPVIEPHGREFFKPGPHDNYGAVLCKRIMEKCGGFGHPDDWDLPLLPVPLEVTRHEAGHRARFLEPMPAGGVEIAWANYVTGDAGFGIVPPGEDLPGEVVIVPGAKRPREEGGNTHVKDSRPHA